MKRLIIFLVLLGTLAHGAGAQPAPAGLSGGWWGGGACNLVTFSGPNGPRSIMVDANGNQCVTGSVTTTPSANTPAAGTASAIVTGGAATTLITGPVNGCYITNPETATEQNIATAEVAYVNPVTTAAATGRGTNSKLSPGQSFSCPPGMTTNLSAIAATTAHAFNVVKW